MPWFKVDDMLHSHPKARRAGLRKSASRAYFDLEIARSAPRQYGGAA